MSDSPKCPDCGKSLEAVRQSASSPLNRDQFEAVKAGDWFCGTCPSNGRGNQELRYFWDRELPELAEQYHGKLVSLLAAVAAIPEAAAWATKQLSDRCRDVGKDPRDMTIGQIVSMWDALRPKAEGRA